jgi:hypothetical protein
MAHSALHFALGAVTGAAAAAPPLAAAWRGGGPLARPYRLWLGASYGLALWAVVPPLLGSLGVPDAVCKAWWMNVFLLHPALTRLKDGGAVAGTLVLLAVGSAQYILLLMGVRLAQRRVRAAGAQSAPHSAPPRPGAP